MSLGQAACLVSVYVYVARCGGGRKHVVSFLSPCCVSVSVCCVHIAGHLSPRWGHHGMSR